MVLMHLNLRYMWNKCTSVQICRKTKEKKENIELNTFPRRTKKEKKQTRNGPSSSYNQYFYKKQRVCM